MEAEFNSFIGRFPDTIDANLNAKFVEWFNSIHDQGITASSMKDTGYNLPHSKRKDECIQIPSGLPLQCFPPDICEPLWQSILPKYTAYSEEYALDQSLTSNSFKMHRTREGGGYHVWHHEHHITSPYRVLVWMLLLEIPEEGGETEFLLQSLRIPPVANQLLIWPAAFTHKHRGNPPLKGQKTYITGWFECGPIHGHG
jgi:hypothetical protein